MLPKPEPKPAVVIPADIVGNHEETEISLITNDATIKRIRKVKAEIVENKQTDIIEDAKVVVEKLQQNKAESISKWSGGMLEFLDETERNK